MTTVFVDPTNEVAVLERPRAKRPSRLLGPVALVNISKPRSDVFLETIGVLLRREHPEIEVNSFSKATYTRISSPQLREEIRRSSTAVVEALAD